MKAFHTNWTKPFFIKHPNEEYHLEDFDILVTILSALKWREKNGSIKLYTDKLGGEYYHKLGLEEIYDLGIDTSLDEIIPKSLDPELFWAGGKLYALKIERCPCIMLDMDFVVWDYLEELTGQDLCVSHREKMHKRIYPDFNDFKVSAEYSFDETWDWKEYPCNTAIVYFGNQQFKDYYVKESIRFMKMNSNISLNHRDRVKLMVFAEQRLLAMSAKKKGINIYPFISNNHSKKKVERFTHIWGYKNRIYESHLIRKGFCESCINIIVNDFPDMYNTLNKIECIKKYLKNIKYNQEVIF